MSTGSGWSAPNKERVERMLALGKMAPAGLAKVTVARTDGSWAALDAVEALELPADLQLALAAHAPAHKHFDAFPRSVKLKRGILEWIHAACKPETRAARIAETALLAALNQHANQWRQ